MFFPASIYSIEYITVLVEFRIQLFKIHFRLVQRLFLMEYPFLNELQKLVFWMSMAQLRR